MTERGFDQFGEYVEREVDAVDFYAFPADVIAGVDRAIAGSPGRGHPRASLWSVRRKAVAELDARKAELNAKRA